MSRESKTGGAHVQSNVTVSGGDFVDGDKIVYIQQPQPYRPPLQRPARADYFQDRTDELARLLTDLQPGAVLTLSGPGGMGKTALAAEAVWRLAPTDQPPAAFPDGIFFHSFYNQPAIDAACENITRAFGQQPQGSPRDNVRRTLAGRSALLILDGAEEADDLPSLLALRDRCAVLITSRDRHIHSGHRTDLPPLPADDAVALIRAWAQQSETHPTPAGGPEGGAADATVAEIARLVGYLPMALRLIGSYLDQNAQTPDEYLAWLQRSPLAALDQGNRRMESVPTLMQRTLAALDDTARALLAVAGLLAFAPFDAAILAHALDRQPDQLRPAFAQLVRYSLLVRDQNSRYQTAHALVHTYARLRLTPSPQSLHRLASLFSNLARELSDQGPTGYSALDPQRSHILAVMHCCRNAAAWDTLSSLVWAVDSYLDIQGYTTERLASIQLGLIATRALSDRRDEGALLGSLGIAYRNLGQADRAIEIHTQALLISREICDRPREGNHLGNLGLAYIDLGQIPQAIEHQTQALTISREIGDRQGEGNCLGYLGIAYAELSQMDRAIDHFTQALAISREIGDRRGEGNHLGNLGNGHFLLRQMDQAIERYTQALTINRKIGDLGGEGNQLGNLGNAYAELGQVPQAIEFYTQALAIKRKIRHRPGEGTQLDNLGVVYNRLGDADKAKSLWQQALAIYEDIQSPHAETVRRLLTSPDESS